uniref:NATT3 protein n=1 Tax=Taeniopygia guttata TaxID=59729 RepID=A0A674GZS7_TAEGU
ETPKKEIFPGNGAQGLALLLLLSAVISGVLGAPGPSGVSGISGIPGRNREELPARSHPAPRRPRSAAGRSWLRWAPFRGRIPAEAVSSPNPRTGRTEFVCSTRGCELGAFDPARGSFCSFAWAEQELRGSDFHLLLNPGGFEALDWVDTSFGSAPEGAVEACPLTDLFVGRSPDGLGKASKEQEALFVAVDGEEVWYKWYQVLVVRQGALGVAIDDVSYNGSAVMESAEPAELTAVLLRNDGCEAADRSITLEELSEVEHGWSAELPALAAARGVLRAAPVLLPERGGWHPGNVTSVPWAGGASLTEFVSRSHRVRLEVPARSECSAVLRGLRREIRVPFSARLTREFRSGRPHRAAVAGWARSSAVTGARAGLERCRPLADLPPCPH